MIGFPDSVSSDYLDYQKWVKYFDLVLLTIKIVPAFIGGCRKDEKFFLISFVSLRIHCKLSRAPSKGC